MRFGAPVTVGPVVGGGVLVVGHGSPGRRQRVGGRQHGGGGRDVRLGLTGNITTNRERMKLYYINLNLNPDKYLCMLGGNVNHEILQYSVHNVSNIQNFLSQQAFFIRYRNFLNIKLD